MSDNNDTETVVPAASESSSSNPPSATSYNAYEWTELEISEAQEFLDSIKVINPILPFQSSAGN